MVYSKQEMFGNYERGAQFVAKADFPFPVVSMALQHERDGKGEELRAEQALLPQLRRSTRTSPSC